MSHLFSCYHSNLFVLRLDVHLHGQSVMPNVSSDGQFELCGHPTENNHTEVCLPMSFIARDVQECLKGCGYGVVDRIMYGDGAPLFQIDTVQQFNLYSLKKLMAQRTKMERKLETSFEAHFPAPTSGGVGNNVEVISELCLMCPDSTGSEVTLTAVSEENVTECFERWQKSSISEFNYAPQVMPKIVNKNKSAARGAGAVHVKEVTMPLLVDELRPVVNWIQFGLALGVNFAKLMEIQRDEHRTEECKMQMFYVWLNSKGGSWADIVRALKFIQMETLAKDIAGRYGVPTTATADHQSTTTISQHLTENGNQLASEDVSKLLQLEEDAVSQKKKIASSDEKARHLSVGLRRSKWRVERMKEKLKELKEELESKEQEKMELQQRVEEMQQNMHKLRSKEIVLEKGLDVASRQHKDMQKQIADKERELEITMQRLSEKKREFKQQNMEKEKLTGRLEQAERELKKKNAEITQLHQEGASNLEELNHRMRKIETFLEKATINPASSTLPSKKQQEKKVKQQECDDFKLRLAEKDKKISDLSKKITELQHQLSMLQTMATEKEIGRDGVDTHLFTSSSLAKLSRSLEILDRENSASSDRRTSSSVVALVRGKSRSNSALSKLVEAQKTLRAATAGLCKRAESDQVLERIAQHWTFKQKRASYRSNKHSSPKTEQKTQHRGSSLHDSKGACHNSEIKQKPRPICMLERHHSKGKQEQEPQLKTLCLQTLPINQHNASSRRSGSAHPVPIPLQLPLPSSSIETQTCTPWWKRLTRQFNTKAQHINSWHKKKQDAL